MKLLVVLTLIAFSPNELATAVTPAQQTVLDEISDLISFMNVPLFNMRLNAQTHYDNSVRTLTEARHNFNIYGNNVPFVEADVNRTVLQDCLNRVRTTTLPIISFLQNVANSPIFDFESSTVTRIETDLNTQMDQLRTAVTSKTNVTCISKVGITQSNLLYNNYWKYYLNLSSCITTAQGTNNLDIIVRFNPPHFNSLALLNQMWGALYSISNRIGVISFLKNYCVESAFTLFNTIQSSAEDCAVAAARNLTICYDQAKTLMPSTVPYLSAINRCT